MASASEALLQPSVPSNTAHTTLRKLDWRVLPLCSGVVFVSYMDRGNVGFVARDLCNYLDLNHKEYGLAVSLFYISYIAIQFVSNELLRHFGGPSWMALIMFTWGCISTAMSLMQSATHFYILRLFLGIAEGGTFPAVYYFLSTFYPARHQTGAYSIVVGSVSLAMPVSALISAGLLTLDGTFGIDGWRYVFIGEGLIPIVYSFVLYFFLPKSPEQTPFLEAHEKQWLSDEHSMHIPESQSSLCEILKQVFKNRTWWIVSLTGMLANGVFNVLMFWIALLIHDALYGEDDDDEESETCGSKKGNATAAVLLTAIPYLVSFVVCCWLHWYDSKVGVQNRPKFVCCVYSIVAVLLVSWIGTRALSFATGFLSLVLAIGLQNLGPACNTALIMSQFDSATRCRCISIINIIASSGALFLPPIVGALVDAHGYGLAVPFLGSLIGIAAILETFASDPLVKQNRVSTAENNVTET